MMLVSNNHQINVIKSDHILCKISDNNLVFGLHILANIFDQCWYTIGTEYCGNVGF